MEQLNYNNTALSHTDMNVQEEVEAICRWAAARAAALAALPKFNYAALLANDVYMVTRIAQVYGQCPVTNGVTGFLMGLGGSAVAALVCTLVPSTILRVPVAAAITYGVGKVAAKWIQDGMPTCENFDEYRKRLVEIYEYNKETVIMLANTPLREKALGNESQDFLQTVNVSGDDYLASAKGFASTFISGDALANVNALKDVALSTVSLVFDSVKEVVEKSGNEELVENVSHAAKGVGSLLKILATEALSLATSAAGTSASKANLYTQEAYAKAEALSATLNESLQGTVEPIVDRASTVVQEVKETVEPVLAQAEDAMIDATNKAIDKAQDAVSELRDKAEDVKAAVEPVVTSAKELAERTFK